MNPRTFRVPVVACATAMVVMGSAAAADSVERPCRSARVVAIRVLLGTTPLLTDRQWQRLRIEAERIWRPAGVALAWSADVTGADVSADLYLVRSPATIGPRVWLGRIVREPASVRARIFLSVDNAERLAGAALLNGTPLTQKPQMLRDEFVAVALGRALAHEIGHAVLDSAGHASFGLMRPTFTVDELLAAVLGGGDSQRFSAEPFDHAAPASPPSGCRAR